MPIHSEQRKKGAGVKAQPPLPKTLTTDEAIQFAASMRVAVSKPTMIKWAKYVGFGKQLAGRGRWYMNRKKLQRFLEDLISDE